jgi:DNA-binding NarL/FixJ family response regulator
MKPVTRLLLISRHKIMTDGLRALFKSERQVRVVGEAADEAEALDLAERTNADIAVIDLIAQVLNAFSVVRELKKQSPALRIVVLSMCSDETYVSQALHNGASGYVLKEESFSSLAQAVQQVAAGGQYLSALLDARAIRERRRNTAGGAVDGFDRLTPREREVLQLAAQGWTSAQIAARLGISRRTAETHRANIYKKLLVESHTDLVALALRRGLLTRDL